MMNLRLNIILLLIVVALGSWYYSQQRNQDAGLADLIKKEGAAEYTGDKMATTVFDPKGNPQYAATAQHIQRYETTDRTVFLKPFLDLFNVESRLKAWKVSAEHAEITHEKLLILKGNVKIENIEAQSRLQKIETESLTIDLNTHDVSSDSVVKSVGMGFTTTGTGLKGNLKKQTATLLKDVKTYIEPTVIKLADDSSTH